MSVARQRSSSAAPRTRGLKNPLLAPSVDHVGYRDVALLATRAVKNAREMALMPYVSG